LNYPRLSYWRFSTFRRAIIAYWWGTFTEWFSKVRGPNFTKLGVGIGRSLLQKNFVSPFRHLAAFSNAGGSNLSDFEKRRQISHFLTHPLWKLGEGCARSLNQLLKLYLPPNLRNTFDSHQLRGSAAEPGVLIKKKERKRKFMGKVQDLPACVVWPFGGLRDNVKMQETCFNQWCHWRPRGGPPWVTPSRGRVGMTSEWNFKKTVAEFRKNSGQTRSDS